MVRGIWCIVALCAWLGSARAAGGGDVAAEAKRHFEEATKLFNLGEFGAAAAEYKAAYKARPDIYYAGATGMTKASGTRVAASTTPPFVVTGLTNQKDYFFVVTAVNEAGESAESAEVTARPDFPVHDMLFAPSRNDGVEIWDCVGSRSITASKG